MTSPASYHLDTIAAANQAGANVLCLPGLFAGSWVFESLLPLIAARGHHASAISFRGHAPLSPLPDIGRQSLNDYRDDAAAAARALDRPILIGHSMGGLVALMLAAEGLARAAILLSPAPSRGISVLGPAILARMARYLPALLFSRAYLPTDADLDALVLNMVPEDQRAAVRKRLAPDSGRVSREIALGVHKISPEAVHVPLLVVGADHDRFIPLGVSRRMANKYGASLHIAQSHGHFLFAEPEWQAQADVVLDWIDALPTDENRPVTRRVSTTYTHRSSQGLQ